MKVDVVAKYIRLSDEDVDTGRSVKQESNSVAVSYTHLTLPTICSV